MAEKKNEKPAKTTADWELIEKHYRAGIMSLREIAKEGGVTEGAIRKRAKRDGWPCNLLPRKTCRGEAFGGEAAGDRSVAISEIDEFDADGFVYGIFIDTGVERLWKVGMAKSPVARLLSHQISLPFEARIGIAYYVPSMRQEERLLHVEFAAKRVRGEWFRLDQADLEFMAQRSLLL